MKRARRWPYSVANRQRRWASGNAGSGNCAHGSSVRQARAEVLSQLQQKRAPQAQEQTKRRNCILRRCSRKVTDNQSPLQTQLSQLQSQSEVIVQEDKKD